MPSTKTRGEGKRGNKSKSKSKSKDKKKQGRKKHRKLNAKTADRYDLYQLAVNSPDADVDFLLRVFREKRGREPHHMREDFCGTAALAAEWISRGEEYTAEGFDLDPEPIEWGKRNNFDKLGDAAARMTFHLKDVRSMSDRRPDLVTAQNFSYQCFMERDDMRAYFQSIYDDLADDGLFVLDMYGGPDSFNELEEVRELENGVDYVWDQMQYWPATGRYECAIHFRFRDGSEMHEAFRYTWRMWGMPEIKDILLEVGFNSADGYFEGSDEDDPEEGNGEFTFDEKGENIDAWIAYVVAAK